MRKDSSQTVRQSGRQDNLDNAKIEQCKILNNEKNKEGVKREKGTMLNARNARKDRVRSGGNQNVFSGNNLSIHCNGVLPGKFGSAMDPGDSLLVDVGLVDTVETLDVGVTLVFDPREVKFRERNVAAKVLCIADSLKDGRRIPPMECWR